MSMKMLILLFAFFVFQPPEYTGKISYVMDGDTFVLETVEGNLRIRMDGIDAPEKDQAFGRESKAFMEKYIYKQCRVKTNGVDRYGRTIGTLFIKGENINLLSVREGFAWHYKKYSSDTALANAENLAKKEGRGLWKDSSPMAPWDWRKSRTN
jgi:endonuclease YncB( thermonuclease family)